MKSKKFMILFDVNNINRIMNENKRVYKKLITNIKKKILLQRN